MFDFKGKSLIDFPDNYTVLDLETTGLDLEFDHIIEISALKVENGEIVDRFSSLIQPPKSIFFKICEDGSLLEEEAFISKFITDLTGITNEMLSTAPLLKSVLPTLKDFIGDDILVGHNIVAFDGNFLCRSFEKELGVEFSNDYIDTLRVSRWLLKELKHHRLSDLSDFFDIDYSNAHRSEADCLITYKCFGLLKDKAIEEYGSISAFLDFLKKKRNKNQYALKAKDIELTADEIDIENPFYGKNVYSPELSIT